MNIKEKSPELIQQELMRYKQDKPRLEKLAKLVSRFLESKVSINIPQGLWPVLHAAQHRAKTMQSLRERLKYKNLEKFGDLAGARLIFYFKDDLKKFAENKHIFAEWFGRLASESFEDKVKPWDKEFGYASKHFTLEVTKGNAFWTSLRKEDQTILRELKCEVQLRTLLQHAWAESEHDLFYKRKEGQELNKNDKMFAERQWAIISATLEGLDDRLVERKKFTEPFLQDKKPYSEVHWKYQINEEKEEYYEQDGVFYQYTLEHTGSPEEINIFLDWQLFDVNQAFNIKNYKTQIWEKLTKDNRDFIEGLNSYDSTTVRILDWDRGKKTLKLQPAVYSDQIVTNHNKVHNFEVPDSKYTIKDFAYGANGKLKPFKESPLANTIGVSCVIRTSDDYWVIGRRAKGMSVFSELWSCPVSGAVEWRERLNWEGTTVKDWFGVSIALECEQELGLTVENNWIKYLGFMREHHRLGKPQFFFLIDMLGKGNHSGLSTLEVDSTWRIYVKDHELVELKHITKEQAKILTGKDEEKIAEICEFDELSEELRINLALAFDYLKL